MMPNRTCLASLALAAVLAASACAPTPPARVAMPAATRTAKPMSRADVAVEQMLAWKGDPRVADELNPFFSPVVALGEEAVPALIERLPEDGSSEAVWALGLIGSRRAFPAVLGRYLLTPNDRLAVTLGSSMARPELTYLRDGGLLSDDRAAHLLAVLLGTPGRPLAGKTLDELWAMAFDEVEQIRQRCIERSRPMAG